MASARKSQVDLIQRSVVSPFTFTVIAE